MKRFAVISASCLLGLVILVPVCWLLVSASQAESGHALVTGRSLSLLKNSLAIAGGTTAVSLIIGMILGWMLGRLAIPCRNLLLAILVLSLLTPSYLLATAWQNWFDATGLWACIGVLASVYAPLPVLVIAWVAGRIPADAEDAASLHGRSQLWRIRFHFLAVPIAMCGMLVFLFSVGNFAVPSLLQVQSYPVEVFAQFSAFGNPQGAAFVALPLLLIAIILFALERLVLHRHHRAGMKMEGNMQRADAGIPGVPWLWTVLLGAFTLTWAFSPLVWFIQSAGGWGNYKLAFETAGGDLWTSIWLSAATATVAVALVLPISWLLARTESRWRWLGDSLCWLPLMIPPSVVGVAMIVFWNRPGLFSLVYGTAAILGMTYLARFITFVFKPVQVAFSQITRDQEEASAMCGMGWMRMMQRILIPQVRGGLLIGWLLMFVFCLGELGASILVTPPGTNTFPVRISQLMHYGWNELVAALCVLLMGLVGLCGLALVGMHRLGKVRWS